MADNPITWADFFNQLKTTEPIVSELSITNKELKLDTYDQRYTDEAAAIRQELVEDPSRRLFVYRYLDDQYGMLFGAEENINQFNDRTDQRYFDMLMEVVRANTGRSGQQT